MEKNFKITKMVSPIILTIGAVLTIVLAWIQWYKEQNSDTKLTDANKKILELQNENINELKGAGFPELGFQIAGNPLNLFIYATNYSDFPINNFSMEITGDFDPHHSKGIPAANDLPSLLDERIERNVVQHGSSFYPYKKDISQLTRDTVSFIFIVGWRYDSYNGKVTLIRVNHGYEVQNVLYFYGGAYYTAEEFEQITRLGSRKFKPPALPL